MFGHRQFIVCRYDRLPDGKIDKVPLNPLTFRAHDAHDPAVWMPYEQAKALAAMVPECGVGFVLTDKDPYFLLDIDHCLQPDGQWSPTATDLCRQFAGCYMERSISGTGLHIIGAYRAAHAHRCDNKEIGAQLYTSGRFCALTGHGAQGNPDYPADQMLQDVVSRYYAGGTACTMAEPTWTDTPCTEWNGITDDTELLQRMLASRSGAQAFGSKAPLSLLWTASPELGQWFPDPSGQRAYDASSADAALCQHLAFWTGKDCERMDRLMRMSGLMRDKWEQREDYRHMTITRAVSLCGKVYGQDRPAPAVADGPPTETRTGFQFLSVQHQQEYFKGCAYVRDIHRMWVPDGALLKPDQFKSMYGGYMFALDMENAKLTKSAWEAFTENRGVKFPKVHTTCFRPERPTGELIQEENHIMVNTYVPVETPRKAGDPAPFLQHLIAMLPNDTDRAMLLSYMAALVQYPGVKFQWCPVIQGIEGNGKSILITAIAHCVGWRYTHLPNSQDLGGNGSKFNAWISGKLFIGIEEVFVNDRREIIEILKRFVTNARIEVQGKGQDQITGDNRANFIMCTNHKDAILKSRKDRRYAIFYTAQQNPEDLHWPADYFPKLYKWLRAEGYAIVNEYLRTYQIDARFNPADTCQRAPVTSSTNEALQLSMGRVEQEIMEAVEACVPGFCGGWISSMAFDKLLIDIRYNKLSYQKRRDILASLGYAPHPALVDGRSTQRIGTEGGKPRLYIKAGHPNASIVSPSDVVKFYSQAQERAIKETDHATASTVFGGSPAVYQGPGSTQLHAVGGQTGAVPVPPSVR